MISNGVPLEKDALHVKYNIHNESRLQISSQGLTVFSGYCIVRSLSLSSFVVKTHLRAFVWGHNKQRDGYGHLTLRHKLNLWHDIRVMEDIELVEQKTNWSDLALKIYDMDWVKSPQEEVHFNVSGRWREVRIESKNTQPVWRLSVYTGRKLLEMTKHNRSHYNQWHCLHWIQMRIQFLRCSTHLSLSKAGQMEKEKKVRFDAFFVSVQTFKIPVSVTSGWFI